MSCGYICIKCGLHKKTGLGLKKAKRARNKYFLFFKNHKKLPIHCNRKMAAVDKATYKRDL